MISYGQNLEDVMLARVFADRPSGFYIDVGAWDPVVDSVTKHFYDRGWSGINLEPSPGFHAQLVAARPRDVNLAVAVGERSERRPFRLIEGSGLSTLSDEPRPELEGLEDFAELRVEMEVRTLREICEEHVAGEIDFLKIDAEGWEEQVIRGADWERFRPRVIVVEAVEANHEALLRQEAVPVAALRPTWDAWEPMLLAARYERVYFDGLNCFYLREEDADLRSHFSVPPNVWDCYRRWIEVHLHEVMDERVAILQAALARAEEEAAARDEESERARSAQSPDRDDEE